jgi:hypothetical protein
VQIPFARAKPWWNPCFKQRGPVNSGWITLLGERPRALDESRRYVEREFGPEAASRLFDENPRAALAGVPLSGIPLPIRRREW